MPLHPLSNSTTPNCDILSLSLDLKIWVLNLTLALEVMALGVMSLPLALALALGLTLLDLTPSLVRIRNTVDMHNANAARCLMY